METSTPSDAENNLQSKQAEGDEEKGVEMMPIIRKFSWSE